MKRRKVQQIAVNITVEGEEVEAVAQLVQQQEDTEGSKEATE